MIWDSKEIHKIEEKRIFLIVTDDYSVCAEVIYEFLNIDKNNKRVVILYSEEKEEQLRILLKRYMKENCIDLKRGDEVYYLKTDKNSFKITDMF